MRALFENTPIPAQADAPVLGARRSPSRGPWALLDVRNEAQLAAVTPRGAPLLIVAGAGSGKTRVLTHRIAYLLAAGKVTPGEIPAIPFTNQAGGEMAG